MKTRYPIQELTNPRGPIPPPTCGEPRLKPEQALYELSPLKLALEGIEPETSGGANSKIPNQPVSQPQMGLLLLMKCYKYLFSKIKENNDFVFHSPCYPIYIYEYK